MTPPTLPQTTDLPVPDLRHLLQAWAMLDAALSPDPSQRECFFRSGWAGPGRHLGWWRHGESTTYAVFTPAGALVWVAGPGGPVVVLPDAPGEVLTLVENLPPALDGGWWAAGAGSVPARLLGGLSPTARAHAARVSRRTGWPVTVGLCERFCELEPLNRSLLRAARCADDGVAAAEAAAIGYPVRWASAG